jgi:hypothetical protein
MDAKCLWATPLAGLATGTDRCPRMNVKTMDLPKENPPLPDTPSAKKDGNRYVRGKAIMLFFIKTMVFVVYVSCMQRYAYFLKSRKGKIAFLYTLTTVNQHNKLK